MLSHQVMVTLIATTTTRNGLTAKAEMDNLLYETGFRVTAQDLAAIPIKNYSF